MIETFFKKVIFFLIYFLINDTILSCAHSQKSSYRELWRCKGKAEGES